MNKKQLKMKFYNTKQWKMCRVDALIKYPMCYRCGMPSCHVDHTILFNDRDDDYATDPDNHIPLCIECHSKVTTKDEHKYRTMHEQGATYEEIRAIKYEYRRIGLDGYPI